MLLAVFPETSFHYYTKGKNFNNMIIICIYRIRYVSSTIINDPIEKAVHFNLMEDNSLLLSINYHQTMD